LLLGIPRSGAQDLTPADINSANFDKWDRNGALEKPQPILVRLQILLDRTNISPGVIDGRMGENLANAVRAYEEREGYAADGEVDQRVWTSLIEKDNRDVMQTYVVSNEDLDRRYVKDIPEDYAELAEMKWIGYRGPKEMLAERFHMDESLLQTLNPGAKFDVVGENIVVAAPGANAMGSVARIVVDVKRKQLFGYDRKNKILLADAASIGSKSNPSPTGVHKIKGVALEPVYSYRPDINFQQGNNDKPLQIPPGPNGPVGLVWIDLSEPTYGIHGTAEPDLINKESSHGCVRLTNWDAQELAYLAKPNVPVEFRN